MKNEFTQTESPKIWNNSMENRTCGIPQVETYQTEKIENPLQVSIPCVKLYHSRLIWAQGSRHALAQEEAATLCVSFQGATRT